MRRRWAYQGAILLFVAVSLAACGSSSTTRGPVSTTATSTTTAPPTTSTAATITTTAPASTSTTVAATTTTVGSTTTSLLTTTTTAAAVSADSIAYAKGLGGTSHQGETLHFVIGASVKSEEEAQALLDEATPRFGDMQSYFIVQRSDNFQGMRPGWWVVVETYRAEPSEENLSFDRRGFPDAYVKRATVRTSDPIPVYEDMVGEP
jgi:hypothetical protein